MKPKVSVVIPFHWMKNWQYFLRMCLESIEMQSFKDYEVILTKAGSMPVNTNRAMKCAKGEVVKVLYMDDWLDSPDYLENLHKAFQDSKVEWVITAAINNREPVWTDDIETGNNKLGSPSVFAFRNRSDCELFDENLSWLLDCDLYKRMEKRFGKPTILENISVGIGEHPGQMTRILTDEQKAEELNYLIEKYG